MSGTRMHVPAELQREFSQFRADFGAVWQAWVEQGEETPEACAAARTEAAEWVAAAARAPDARERLLQLFAYWSELRHRVAPIKAPEVAVVPGYSERDLQQMRARREGRA